MEIGKIFIEMERESNIYISIYLTYLLSHIEWLSLWLNAQPQLMLFKLSSEVDNNVQCALHNEQWALCIWNAYLVFFYFSHSTGKNTEEYH